MISYGGTGNDTLNGGYHGDTYVFSKGHGQDVITDYSGGSEGEDRIIFTDINLSDVSLHKQGSDLLLTGYVATDSVRINSFFSNSYYGIEKMVFADSSVSIDREQINKLLSGTESMISAMAAFTSANSVSATDWTADNLKNILPLIITTAHS